jgi:hypothetical protein
VGRVHLVGEAPAGLSGKRRSGLRDLAIAVAAGALIWIGDAASGGNLAGVVNAFASRLAAWFEDRREPVVNCEPGKPRPYTALAGVVLQVPQCWEVEVVPLLDREVHRFHDPEARAGTLSVSVEPIGGDEDRRVLEEEFGRLEALPGARVNGKPVAETAAETSAAGASADGKPGAGADAGVDTGAGADTPQPGAAPDAHDAPYRPGTPDSLAERILHGASGKDGSAAERDGAGAAGAGHAPATSSASAGFRRVEAGGLMGIPPPRGKSALQPDGTYAKRTWRWLLVGEREAVRLVYAVRADWSESAIVGKEFRRANAVAESAAEYEPAVSAPAESAPAP